MDATNIERNLYLTLQLLEMHIPMVLALNMMDEVRGNGGSIDYRQMSQELGIPVIPISAAKDEGIEDLIAAIVEVAGKKIPPKVMEFLRAGTGTPLHSRGVASGGGSCGKYRNVPALCGDEDRWK